MFELKICDTFAASHQLKGYKGKCESLHGHNWKVEVTVKGAQLNDIGLLVDFKELKKILASVIEKLDHKHLNDIKPFVDVNPSSENLSEYIYKEFKTLLPSGINIASVTVWESDTAGATFTS